ncbi:hypothetical protein ACFE04_021171 [Oxalis oulophora]
MSDHLTLNVDRLKRPESTDEEEEHGDADFSDQLLIPTMAKCRICQEEDSINSLETPCGCSGSLKYAHRKCVQHWCNEKGDIMSSKKKRKEILSPYHPGYTAPPHPPPEES